MSFTVLEKWIYTEGDHKVNVFYGTKTTGTSTITTDLARVVDVEMYPVNGAGWSQTEKVTFTDRTDDGMHVLTVIGVNTAKYLIKIRGF